MTDVDTIGTVAWFRDEARYSRQAAWFHATYALQLVTGDTARSEWGVANHDNDRANAYDAAADALELLERAKGVEPFDVRKNAADDGMQLRDGDWLIISGDTSEHLADRLIATALALRGTP